MRINYIAFVLLIIVFFRIDLYSNDDKSKGKVSTASLIEEIDKSRESFYDSIAVCYSSKDTLKEQSLIISRLNFLSKIYRQSRTLEVKQKSIFEYLTATNFAYYRQLNDAVDKEILKDFITIVPYNSELWESLNSLPGHILILNKYFPNDEIDNYVKSMLMSIKEPTRLLGLIMDLLYENVNSPAYDEYLTYINSKCRGETSINEYLDGELHRQGLINQQIIDYSFALPEDTTQSINISDYKGKWLLIDFWTTNCGHCINEFPILKEINSLFEPNKFKLIGINLDNNFADFQKFISINQAKFNWQMLYDKSKFNGIIGKYFNIKYLPFKVLINPQGKIELLGNQLKTDSILSEIKKRIR